MQSEVSLLTFILAAYGNYYIPMSNRDHPLSQLLHGFVQYSPSEDTQNLSSEVAASGFSKPSITRTPSTTLNATGEDDGRDSSSNNNEGRNAAAEQSLLSALTESQILLILDVSKGFDTVLKAQAKGHDEAATYFRLLSLMIRMCRFARFGSRCFDGIVGRKIENYGIFCFIEIFCSVYISLLSFLTKSVLLYTFVCDVVCVVFVSQIKNLPTLLLAMHLQKLSVLRLV